MKQITKALVAGLLLSEAVTARSATIFFDDFQNPVSDVGVDYVQGDVQNPQFLFTGGALVLQAEHTGANPGVYAGFWRKGFLTGNTSPNPADYILSFDATALGDVSTGWSGIGGFSVEIWLGDTRVVPQDGMGHIIAGNQPPDYSQIVATADGAHYDLNLGDPSLWAAPFGRTIDQVQPQHDLWKISFGMQADDWGPGPQTFGLGIDNLTLTMIPEPSTWSLLIMGAFALLGSRRLGRRSS